MGLDMYLQRVYKPTEQQFADAYDDKLTGVLYWRKVNSLHAYFVRTGKLEAGGEQDVGYYVLNRNDLYHLVDLMDQILNNHSLAETLLPTQAGFFFGSTDYDDWYFKDLEDAKALVVAELEVAPDQDVWFYYASW
jgi:hypothetical protein